jgi:predicted porin
MLISTTLNISRRKYMNKKILFAAVGAAIAASPMIAQANVTVGGHAQVEYFQSKIDTTGSASDKNSGLIDNARGRFWINASEDLGGGMKALARYEFSVDTANSGQSSAAGNGAVGFDATQRTFDQRTREKYVGLSGGFGTVTAGNLHGVYKRMGGVRWDPVNATVLEARGNGGQSGSGDVHASFAHNGFIPGAIKWESGAVTGPVNVEVLFAPNKDGNPSADQSDGNDFQAGVSFKPMPGLEVLAVTAKNKQQPSSTNSSQSLTKFGARYNMGPHTFWVQVEDADVNNNATFSAPTSVGITTASKGERKYNWFGYSLKMGNNTFVAQYGDAEASGSGFTTTDTTYISLAVLHSLSKNTTAHVGYRSTEAETGSSTTKTTVFAGGLRVNF